MSFSNDVRVELARIIPEKSCCQKAELWALLNLRATVETSSAGTRLLRTEVENAATASKIYKLLKLAYNLASTVKIKTKRRFKKSRLYVVETSIDGQSPFGADFEYVANRIETSNLTQPIKGSLPHKSCCRRAYLRGMFITRGFINRPEGNYHLELVINDSRTAIEVQKIMQRLDLPARISERQKNLILYIKESEKIVDFLRLVKASNALLEFENVRIVKSMRNQVNRQVNCETANLAKTVDASVRQVEMIEKLLSQIGIQGIPRSLRDLALLRIEHPDSTLKELGALLYPPLTKSGVAYRMKKLEDFAADSLGE